MQHSVPMARKSSSVRWWLLGGTIALIARGSRGELAR